MTLILLLLTTCIFTTTLYPLENLSDEQLVTQYAWETPHINPKRVMLSETPPWYYFSHSACTEYTQQKQLRNAVTNYICDTKDDLLACARSISLHLLKNDEIFLLSYTSANLVKAIHETVLNPHKTTTITYSVEKCGIDSLINRPEFGLKQFESYEGTPLQHAIHAKNHSSLIYLHRIKKELADPNSYDCFLMETLLLYFIASSEAYNEAGNFLLAFYTANVSYNFIISLYDETLDTMSLEKHNRDDTKFKEPYIFQETLLTLFLQILPEHTEIVTQSFNNTIPIEQALAPLIKYIYSLKLPPTSEFSNKGELLRRQKELQGARNFAKAINVLITAKL